MGTIFSKLTLSYRPERQNRAKKNKVEYLRQLLSHQTHSNGFVTCKPNPAICWTKQTIAETGTWENVVRSFFLLENKTKILFPTFCRTFWTLKHSDAPFMKSPQLYQIPKSVFRPWALERTLEMSKACSKLKNRRENRKICRTLSPGEPCFWGTKQLAHTQGQNYFEMAKLKSWNFWFFSVQFVRKHADKTLNFSVLRKLHAVFFIWFSSSTHVGDIQRNLGRAETETYLAEQNSDLRNPRWINHYSLMSLKIHKSKPQPSHWKIMSRTQPKLCKSAPPSSSSQLQFYLRQCEIWTKGRKSQSISRLPLHFPTEALVNWSVSRNCWFC